MTGELTAVHAAGRTDAGVHALAMTAHVDIAKTVTEHRLREGLNALVRPEPISVTDGPARQRRLARPFLMYRAQVSLSHPKSPSAAGAGSRASMAYRRAAGRRCDGGGRGNARRPARLHHVPLGPLPVGQPGEDARQAGREAGRRGNSHRGGGAELPASPGAVDGRLPCDGRPRPVAAGRHPPGAGSAGPGGTRPERTFRRASTSSKRSIPRPAFRGRGAG